MNDYAHYLKTGGFCSLDYFNVYNFGGWRRKPGGPLWNNPRAFLAASFPHAPLTTERGVVDWGDPDFENFLLEQAERDTGHKWMEPRQYYPAYGPLLDAMRGKKWVLVPHCVEVAGGAAKVNLFKVPGGYAMPACFGGKAEFAVVIIRSIPGLDNLKYSAIHPGAETAVSATILSKRKDGATRLRVPLPGGCAMVTLRS